MNSAGTVIRLTARPATTPRSGAPYRTDTTTVVSANGMTTAVTHTITVEVSHLLTRTLVRDTGFEIVHASVPLSRSARSRLIVAKIAARTMNCVPSARSKLSRGWTERTLAGPSPASAGKDRAAHSVIRAFAAERAKTDAVTVRTTHGRFPWSHSATSLRRRLPRPRSRAWPALVLAMPDGSAVMAFMRHAPWSR